MEIAADSPASPEGLVELVLLDREVVEAAEIRVVRPDLEAGLHDGQVEPVRGGVDDRVGPSRAARMSAAVSPGARTSTFSWAPRSRPRAAVPVDQEHALDAVARRRIGGRDPAHASRSADHRNAHRASVAASRVPGVMRAGEALRREARQHLAVVPAQLAPGAERVQHRLLGGLRAGGEEQAERIVASIRSPNSSAPSRGSRFAVVQANAISPEPCEPYEPVRARPTNGLRASRRSWCGSSGASVATRQMHEPSPLEAVSRASSRPTGPPTARSARSGRSSRARARRRCARRRRATRSRCRRRSRTSPCRRRRRSGPRRPRRRARRRAPRRPVPRRARGPRAHRTTRTVALADDRDDHVVTADARLARRQDARRAGVHGADVRRGREEHGRLLVAPLIDRLRARELARAVERRRRAEVRVVPGSPPCGQTAVTPVWSGTAFAWPTRTPGTSVIAFAGPVGTCPTTNPYSRARICRS